MYNVIRRRDCSLTGDYFGKTFAFLQDFFYFLFVIFVLLFSGLQGSCVTAQVYIVPSFAGRPDSSLTDDYFGKTIAYLLDFFHFLFVSVCLVPSFARLRFTQ